MTVQMDLSRMELRAAKLCIELDCNTIFDAADLRHCPTCGSFEFYPLESWLNRDRLPEKVSSGAGVDALSRDAVQAERARWLRRLRERRAESDARQDTHPLTLQTRGPRRRAG